MSLFKWKKKLEYNETPASVFWANGKEDELSLFFESGLYYNHEYAIAVAEPDSMRVDVYEFRRPDQPADHIGEMLELRKDPQPITHSTAVWDALKTQDEIASSGSRRRRSGLLNRHSNTWNQLKIWSFIIGLIALSGATFWSLKIGSDAIDIIDRQIIEEFNQRQLQGLEPSPPTP